MRNFCRNFYQKIFSKKLKCFGKYFHFQISKIFRFFSISIFEIFFHFHSISTYHMEMKTYFETQNRKHSDFSEIWKWNYFPKFLKIFFDIFSANVAHDDASSLYPISRDEFRRTATLSQKVISVALNNTHVQEFQYSSLDSMSWSMYYPNVRLRLALGLDSGFGLGLGLILACLGSRWAPRLVPKPPRAPCRGPELTNQPESQDLDFEIHWA